MGPQVAEPMMQIRRATDRDREAVWRVIEPMIAAGDAFVFEGATARDDALALFFHPAGRCYVAEIAGEDVGSYILEPNQPGRGSHIANGAYAVHPAARGRGLAKAMGEHSIAEARAAGYAAIQFNIVVSTTEPAVGLWGSLGFRVLATLPGAFRDERRWRVDAYVMWLDLTA